MSRRIYPFILMLVAFPAAHGPAGRAAAAPLSKLAEVKAIDVGDTPDEIPGAIGVGDFNHDGIPDIAEAIAGDSPDEFALMTRIGQSDGSFRNGAASGMIDGHPSALVVGDFNRDGNLDVVVGLTNGAMLEFLGDGKGNLRAPGNVAELGRIASVAVGHFTHNGNLDLVVSDFGSNSAVILLGSGSGSFQRAWSFQLPRRGRAFHIATADFNRDGITDLIVASDEDDDYEVMLGNGNGTFTYAPQLSRVRDPNSYCPS